MATKNTKTATLARALVKSEEFIAFRSFTHAFITSDESCTEQLQPYIRRRKPENARRFIEMLSTRIAFEAWLRTQRQSGTNDDIILNAEVICSDLKSFIRQIHLQ